MCRKYCRRAAAFCRAPPSRRRLTVLSLQSTRQSVTTAAPHPTHLSLPFTSRFAINMAPPICYHIRSTPNPSQSTVHQQVCCRHVSAYLLPQPLHTQPISVYRSPAGSLLACSCSCSCSLAVLDPRVGHAMDVLSPFIPVLCHSD